MIKKIIVLGIIHLVTFASLFCTSVYPASFQGTYIPVSFKTSLEQTKSYYKSIKETEHLKLYDVLCLRNNAIFSNVKFHDAYMLTSDKLTFKYTTLNNIQYITDTNTGHEYIKLSDSTDYYSAISNYLSRIVIDSINQTDLIKFAINDDGYKYLNNIWKIDLDKYHYEDDVLIILYNAKRNGEYLGLVQSNGSYSLYTMDRNDEAMCLVKFRQHKKYEVSTYNQFLTSINDNYNKGDALYNNKEFYEAASFYHEVVDIYNYVYYINHDLSFSKKDINDSIKQTYYYSLYNISCCYSLLGKYYLSRQYLFKSIESGYPYLQHILDDRDLDKLSQYYPTIKNDIKDFYSKTRKPE